MISLKAKSHDESNLSIMTRIEIDPSEYEKYFTWHSEHYTRNCLAKCEGFELLLICFEPGQYSKVHNYNARDVWVHPIMGKIKEERFRKTPGIRGLEQLSNVTLDAREYSFVCENIGIHRYTNLHNGRSATLNLYSKPIDHWDVYDELSGESYRQEVERHSMYY